MDDDGESTHGHHIRRDLEPHRGGMILGFGIGSMVTWWCCNTGIMPVVGIALGAAAWIMGRADLKKMDAGTMDPDGRAQTNAGAICGMVGCVVNVLALIALAIYIVVLITVASMQNTG